MEQGSLLDALNNGNPVTVAHPMAVAPVGFTPVTKVVTKILDKTPIGAATETALADCTAIDLHNGAFSLAITVETTFNAAATQGITVHVLTSYDGINYDTNDWDAFNPDFTAGASIQQTKNYETSPAYIKVLIENLDTAQSVTNTKVYSIVG